jgi:hypothetical protein
MTKLKIPPVIKIGTHPYKVQLRNNLFFDENKLGSVDHRIQLIEVDPTIAFTVRNQTFFHEVVHIIERVYGLVINEDDVDRLSQGICEVLVNSFNIKFDWTNIKEVK